MNPIIINVSEIEELQTIRDTDELDRIFNRARMHIVGGGTVELVRKQGGKLEKFEEFSTLDDFIAYRNWVYKYL